MHHNLRLNPMRARLTMSKVQQKIIVESKRKHIGKMTCVEFKVQSIFIEK